MGTVGKYNSTFSGKRRGRNMTGMFYGGCVATTKLMDMSSVHKSVYMGKFTGKIMNKALVGGARGQFKLKYSRMQKGGMMVANATGTFTVKFVNMKFVITERAEFQLKIGDTRVRGMWCGKFDGKTFSAKLITMRGRKKSSVKRETTIEGGKVKVFNKGGFTVWANGQKRTTDYKSHDWMVPSQSIVVISTE